MRILGVMIVLNFRSGKLTKEPCCESECFILYVLAAACKQKINLGRSAIVFDIP